MKKLLFRRVCLFLQFLVTLLLGGVIVFGVLGMLRRGDSPMEVAFRLGPPFLHLLLSLILSMMVSHYLHTTFGGDAQILPFLLLLLSILDLRIYPVCALPIPLGMSLVGRVYQITLLVALLISMACMLYQTEINTKRINSGVFTACVLSILVGMTVPISPNSFLFKQGAFIGALIMRLGMCALGGVGCIIFILYLLQESVSKESIFKNIAYLLGIIAIVFLAFPYSEVLDPVASLLELISLIILVLVARSRRVWT